MLTGLTDRIRRTAAGREGFGKSILLDLGADGAIRIDGSGERVSVNNAPGAADATISMSAETLEGLMSGRLGAPMAVMTGKIKLAGDASLALKLAKFLG